MDLDEVVGLLRRRRIALLTGAGCSTESGIPDYRGPETPPRARPPIQHREFVDHPEARRRYWARSVLGWPRFSAARPNPAHAALAALAGAGLTTGLVTQNVDGLHQAAGSADVVELHGALRRVRCLACGELTARSVLQRRLLSANPGWADRAGTSAPDGDADLDDGAADAFLVVPCLACGGVLMPDVVFFGGSVPREVVDAAWSVVNGAEALLVVGSSLTVWSGYRFVKGAAERGLTVVLLNRGPTRADPLASVRLELQAGVVLPRLVGRLIEELTAPSPPCRS